MTPSKENCQKALSYLQDIEDGDKYPDCPPDVETAKKFLKEFLEAAYKRLPTEAAIKRDKERRNSKRGK